MSSASAAPSSDHPAASTPRRGRFSIRDIGLSFGVLIVPILAVILLFRFLGADPVTRVDPSDAYLQAANAGKFTVLESQGLPPGWQTTAAAFQRDETSVTLRVGLVAPDGGFVRFAQTDRPIERTLREELGGARRSTGATEINGARWLSYPGRGAEQALVSTRRDGVVLVTGTASAAELREVAASLR